MNSRSKKNTLSDGRETLASLDKVQEAPEGALTTSPESQNIYKDVMRESLLPAIPEIPGWHVSWAITNSYESVEKRVRLGFTPVKADELPQLENCRVKSGKHKGYLEYGENSLYVLLYKMPIDLHQEIMAHFHTDTTPE